MSAKIALPLIAACGLLAPLGGHAAPIFKAKTAVYTPAPGSRERREMMDALRTPFLRTFHERVIFRVRRLKTDGKYAYLDAQAVGASGKPAAALAEMGGSVSAFYQKRGGHWKVLDWGSYGGTDLVDKCRQNYPSAPRALFL